MLQQLTRRVPLHRILNQTVFDKVYYVFCQVQFIAEVGVECLDFLVQFVCRLPGFVLF